MRHAALILMMAGGGQTPSADARAEFERQVQALVAARVPKAVPKPAPLTPRWLTYKQGSDEALRTGKHLVVGIGCDPPEGAWVSARTETLAGFDPPCVSTSRPHDGVLWKWSTFPAGVAAREIEAYFWPDAKKGFKQKHDPYPDKQRTRSWN